MVRQLFNFREHLKPVHLTVLPLYSLVVVLGSNRKTDVFSCLINLHRSTMVPDDTLWLSHKFIIEVYDSTLLNFKDT